MAAARDLELTLTQTLVSDARGRERRERCAD
jgi:hypothetical protein